MFDIEVKINIESQIDLLTQAAQATIGLRTLYYTFVAVMQY
jgi:hypothetical protein